MACSRPSARVTPFCARHRCDCRGWPRPAMSPCCTSYGRRSAHDRGYRYECSSEPGLARRSRRGRRRADRDDPQIECRRPVDDGRPLRRHRRLGRDQRARRCGDRRRHRDRGNRGQEGAASDRRRRQGDPGRGRQNGGGGPSAGPSRRYRSSRDPRCAALPVRRAHGATSASADGTRGGRRDRLPAGAGHARRRGERRCGDRR